MARSVLILAANALVALVAATPVAAETFVVTKRGDPVPDGCKPRDCSLREAVIAANTNPGKDVIELPNRRKPYTLTQTGSNEDGVLDGDLDISNNPLVIKHPGKGRATVEQTEAERVFEVFAGAPTTFRKLVVEGGNNRTSLAGGGIRAEANVKVFRGRVAGNRSFGDGAGIGLEPGVGLELVRSVVAGNEIVPFSDVVIPDGGGISVADGRVTILRSTIARNAAFGNGGGFYLESVAPGSRIVDSTIARNSASQGGGGHISGVGAPLRIRKTTIAGNRAGRGGGLFLRGPAVIANSTLAGNRANSDGGGIHYGGFGNENPGASLNAVTIARNVADADDAFGGTGGGIYRMPTMASAETLAIENSLLGLNRLGSGERNDCAGRRLDSLGHNLVSTLGPPVMVEPGVTCIGFDRLMDRVRGNPRIGKLKRNGGPTKTIALRKRSPAINKASRRNAPNRDQRGERRGRKKDIGAYERNTGR